MAIFTFTQLCVLTNSAAFCVIFVGLISESHAECQAAERSTRTKFRNSELVVLASFVQYRSRFPNSVKIWAEFNVLEVYKSKDQTLYGAVRNGSTVFLPLYDGHRRTSKQIWCLNERILRRDAGQNERTIFVLFLRKNVGAIGGTPTPPAEVEIEKIFESSYVPVRDSETQRRFLRRLIRDELLDNILTVPSSGNDMATADDMTITTTENSIIIPAETVFELQIDTSQSPDSPVIIQTAEASEFAQLRVRCQVSGAVHAGNPDLGWVFKGQLLQESDSLKINVEDNGRETNLKITEFQPEHQGDYECSVKRPDNIYHKTKLDLKLMTKPHDPTLLGEQLCGIHWNTYCQNGGTCYEHKESKAKSCKCPESFIGRRCEIQQSHLTLISHEEYQRSMIVMGSIFGAVLLVILMGLLYYYQRGRFCRGRGRLVSETTDSRNSSAIKYHTRLANGNIKQHHNEDMKLLPKKPTVPCPRCGNQSSFDQSFEGIPAINSADLGPAEIRQTSGAAFLANGRPASLPSSVGTSPNVNAVNGEGGTRKEFFPFDPHCSQCIAEWRHISFSFPGPVAQGMQYASLPQGQQLISSQEIVTLTTTTEGDGANPTQVKRQTQLQRQAHFETPKKERRYGVSDDHNLLTPTFPDDNQIPETSFSVPSKSLSRELSNASSSHDHQSFAPRVCSPSSSVSSILGGSKKMAGGVTPSRSQERTVRFEDRPETSGARISTLTEESKDSIPVIPIRNLPESPGAATEARSLLNGAGDRTVAWVARTDNDKEKITKSEGEIFGIKETALSDRDVIPPIEGQVDVTITNI